MQTPQNVSFSLVMDYFPLHHAANLLSDGKIRQHDSQMKSPHLAVHVAKQLN